MKPIMQSIYDLLNKSVKESDNSLVLLAVEFSPDGFPILKTGKVVGSPAATIAGLELLRDMIDEQMKSIMNKIEVAADASSKLEDIMSMINTTDVADPRLKEFLNETEEGAELKELIKKLKKDFGKYSRNK